MSGWEEFVVWLFGILMAAVTVQQVAKAKAEVWLQAQQARAPLYPPATWSKGAEQ